MNNLSFVVQILLLNRIKHRIESNYLSRGFHLFEEQRYIHVEPENNY